MKRRSYVILPFLLAVIAFASSIVPGFCSATHPNITLYGRSDQALQVWFNGSPELTILYPTFYEFNVAAETSPGLWITCLHWDFGDGSTLDVPFSAQGYVSDVRYHQYSQLGTYTVAVTAYDNMGDFGTAQITVIWTNGQQSDLGGYSVQVSLAAGGPGRVSGAANLYSAEPYVGSNLDSAPSAISARGVLT